MKIKLIIEYNGSQFSGWQKQPGQKTVQDTISSALAILINSEAKKKNITYRIDTTSIDLIGSGRTDAGVHALEQVACFSWPDVIPFDEFVCISSLNGMLFPHISVLSVEPVSDSFHPRISAIQKTYLYKILHRYPHSSILHGYVWHIRKIKDLDSMLNAGSIFVGAYDFNAFRASDCNAKTSTRTIHHSNFSVTSDTIEYTVSGSGFLKHQVRFMLGALVALGQKKLTLESIYKMRDEQKRIVYQIAPAHGLYLKEVIY